MFVGAVRLRRRRTFLLDNVPVAVERFAGDTVLLCRRLASCRSLSGIIFMFSFPIFPEFVAVFVRTSVEACRARRGVINFHSPLLLDPRTNKTAIAIM